MTKPDPTEDGKVFVEGVLKKQYLRYGYLYVKHKQIAYRVHRLVAEKFVPNPLGLPFVNHLDGNKANNSAHNLEWCTQRQNVHHALRNGLHPNPEVAVIGIKKDTGKIYQFVSQAKAAKISGAKQSNISKCLSGLRKSAGGWTWQLA